jgi:hypothetical protein
LLLMLLPVMITKSLLTWVSWYQINLNQSSCARSSVPSSQIPC